MTQSYKSSETNAKKGHTIRVMKGKHIKWWWIALAVVLLAAAVIVIVIAANRKAPENTPAPESGTSTEATTESPPTSNPEAEPDYSVSENWAYFGIGEDQPVDLFLICPTVDMKDEYNMAMDDEETKASFLGALNMERGIYEESTRMYAPYYRQAAMKIYSLDPDEREPWLALAYTDVSAAFSWYLTHENNGRPIILAGFSQGADLCYRLLEEYFDDETLYDRLIAVYAIGWPCTQELVDAYPQIKPAQSAEDLGVVISFDCEAPEVSETFITPDGTKGLSINPLNWRTDGTPADKSENLGTCFTDYSGTITGEIPALCGCYLDEARGVVKVTDVSAADYPAVVPGLPEGAYHVYDYLFFYRNLQQNVKLRTERYLAGVQDRQPAAAATVQPGVGSLSREGYTLEQVVVLSRHNIRSPLSGSGSALGTITPHEWFQWSSNPSELSLRGGVLETEMGQYFRKWLESEGLFPENYHPTEDEVRVYANSKQRTIATAEYFVSGLLPTANTPIETHVEYDTMDPVFTPQLTFVSPDYNAAAEEQVWEIYGDTVASLVDRNVALMGCKKLLGVSGLAVGFVNGAGAGIIRDLLFHHGNLGHALLRCLDLIGQCPVFFGCGCRPFFQLRVVHQAMLLQIGHCLRHLLEVKLFGPVCVSSAVSLSQLRLDVDQKLVGALRLLLMRSSLPWCMLSGFGDDFPKLRWRITLSKRIHAEKPLLCPS